MSTVNFTPRVKPQLIILYGPPGSGKGTQANILSKEFGYTFVDFGQSFRNFVKENLNKEIQNSLDHGLSNVNPTLDQRALRVKQMLETGQAILTEDFYFIIESKINEYIDSKTLFIIDKPGSLNDEAQWLSSLVINKSVSNIFINLVVPMSVSVDRISHRFYIPSSSEPFLSYQQAMENSKAGEIPYQRPEDENRDITLKRIDNLYGHSDEILLIYKSKGIKVINIDATGSIEEVNLLIKKEII